VGIAQSDSLKGLGKTASSDSLHPKKGGSKKSNRKNKTNRHNRKGGVGKAEQAADRGAKSRGAGGGNDRRSQKRVRSATGGQGQSAGEQLAAGRTQGGRRRKRPAITNAGGIVLVKAHQRINAKTGKVEMVEAFERHAPIHR
jgi:hypothetical protein